MSWQGNPPHRTSTYSTSLPLILVMSPWLGTPGQCFASTLLAYGSISENQAVLHPIQRAARSNPPMPANRLPTRIVLLEIRTPLLRGAWLFTFVAEHTGLIRWSALF